LARVGVADDRDDGDRPVAPPRAVAFAVGVDIAEFALQRGDAVARPATVYLDLRLAGSAQADAAARTSRAARAAAAAPAGLAREVSPHAGHAGQAVFEQRDLDLEATFVGLGA